MSIDGLNRTRRITNTRRTSDRSSSTSGTQPVRRSSVVSVTATTSTASAVSSCSMLPRVSHTRTFPTGTVRHRTGVALYLANNAQVISFASARTSLSFLPVTRLTLRSARSRPSPSPSTARRTSSTTTSQPSRTTTSRSLSSGLPGNSSVTRLW